MGDRRIGKTSLLNYLAAPRVRAAYDLGAASYSFVYADLQLVDDSMGPEQLWRQLLASLHEQCQDEHLTTAFINAQAAPGSKFSALQNWWRNT